jgi:diguanylate cyclase (GGDEF)-like protein
MPDSAVGPESSDQLAVLVVDDEVWIAEELMLGLEEAGLRVQMATSAVTAQAALAETDEIGVVVTDIRMPGEDGLSLVRRLVMNRPPPQAIETVVMTGHATIEDAVAAVRAGAFDFVRKPFTLDEMIDVVRNAMSRAIAKRRDARETQRMAAAQADRDAGRTSDPVTGLPDRAAFAARIAALAAAPAERRQEAGVIALDLDRFTALNDASGSQVGDAVVVEIANRLREAMGEGWMLARVGGDDFAMLAEDCGGPAMLLGRAEQIRTLVERPVTVGADTLRMTASLGVAHGAAAQRIALYDAATLAVGAAKRAGGARVMVFTSALQEAAERRLTIIQDLQHAVARNQVELYFQPIFRVADRTLLGFESLMRWRHPVLGPVSPAEFIPIAEEGPAILELGAWALETAARQAASWRGAVEQGLYINVNISGRQVADADVPAQFAAALAQNGLPPSALVAEMTESVALGPKAAAVVEALQAQGLRVALDDFGAGYSSLGVLGSLQVDVVKLDRSLVAGVSTEPREKRLFMGLVATIHALGLKVVVEGIETEGQLQVAHDAGCMAAQGYLLARPLTAAAAAALVTQHAHAAP